MEGKRPVAIFGEPFRPGTVYQICDSPEIKGLLDEAWKQMQPTYRMVVLTGTNSPSSIQWMEKEAARLLGKS